MNRAQPRVSRTSVGGPGVLGQPATRGPVSPPGRMARAEAGRPRGQRRPVRRQDARRPGGPRAPGQLHAQPAQADERPRRRPRNRDQHQGKQCAGPRDIPAPPCDATGPAGRRRRTRRAPVVRCPPRSPGSRTRQSSEDESLADQAPDGHDGETPAELVPPFAGHPPQGLQRMANRCVVRLFLGREVPSRIVQTLGQQLGYRTDHDRLRPSAAACRSASFSETWPFTRA